MSPERIAELKNKTIDLSDIPEVTSEQAKEFYPRKLRKVFLFLSQANKRFKHFGKVD